MCINKGITDKDAVFIVLEHYLFFQKHTAYAVECCGHCVTIELSDIFVTFRTVIIALILVQTKIELGAVLNNGGVERREEHMVLVVEFRYGHDEQAMILARITIYNRRAGICSRTISTQQLAWQRLFEVCHQSFFESQITHRFMIKVHY